jgi:para-nitrobenzyl esterase
MEDTERIERMRKIMVVLAAMFAIMSSSCSEQAAKPAPVRVETGLVQGVVADGLTVYRGIPFAEPPVGERRWRAPVPASNWNDVRLADKFAPGCMQMPVGDSVIGYMDLPFSEDCLYLNVWTPAKSADERLPVMVWIHGGGFNAGATSVPLYSGENLAKKGVVVASISYRLGPFGFLALPELSAESGGHGSGNYGLLDQVAGLGWIKRNIAAFGGDPNRVTIFGESAGGISVSILAASPLAKGLLQGAISESGGSFAPAKAAQEGGQNIIQLSVAERNGAEFLKTLGAQTVADGRKLPAEALRNGGRNGFERFWAVLDGYAIAGDQYKLYQAGNYNDVPVLIGTNSDEGAAFVQSTTSEAYKAFVKGGFGLFADQILAAYPAGSDEEALRSQRGIWREVAFGWGTWSWARLQSQNAKSKVFVYYFDHRPPYPQIPPYQTWGAAHGAEMHYVLGRHDRPAMAWTAADEKLAEMVSSFWVNFAKTGDPNGSGLPEWPAYDNANPLLMRFDDNPQASKYPNLEKLLLWEKYYAWRRGEMPAP